MGEPATDTPTFVRTPLGDELVIMTRATYDRLLGALDARAFADETIDDVGDAGLAARLHREWDAAGRPSVPFAVVRRVRAGDSYLKALRVERGLTQAALAAKAGIAQGYLSEIESESKVPTGDKLERLAAALDVHPFFLSEAAPRPAAAGEPAQTNSRPGRPLA